MKAVLHIDSDPPSAAPISPTDFQRILAEKDHAIAQRDALLKEPLIKSGVIKLW